MLKMSRWPGQKLIAKRQETEKPVRFHEKFASLNLDSTGDSHFNNNFFIPAIIYALILPEIAFKTRHNIETIIAIFLRRRFSVTNFTVISGTISTLKITVT